MPQYDRIAHWYAGFTQDDRLRPPVLPNNAVLKPFWASLIEDDIDETPWETSTGTVIGTERSNTVRLLADSASAAAAIPSGAGIAINAGSPDQRLLRFAGRELTARRKEVTVSAEVTIRTASS